MLKVEDTVSGSSPEESCGTAFQDRERTSGLPVPQEDQPMGCLAMGNVSFYAILVVSLLFYCLITMLMTVDNPVRRQLEKVTEQSISSARNYLDNGGMWSARGMDDRGASKYSMSITMYRSGAKGYGRPRTSPPDLPSLIFDTRIVYLVMPVVL
ncbi:ATP-dependent Clp protease proteolytic subunit-related protein 1, chloroplastic-like isoform X2 [Spinacia oleracea]|uniref:ATP-dependent Clp protease proteolytic subunit-related protein 1, chloroplastic-like isoform X2 n=1 Tax=Spinacia oleracea TaxID=3562 RepID=A0ABM3QMZ7_SPIOL|nr:ATP-dependent Clp protease proteolytic subunit-related protein 1, chloroplastic-like isoform X2 [Spinacia oleracea]